MQLITTTPTTHGGFLAERGLYPINSGCILLDHRDSAPDRIFSFHLENLQMGGFPTRFVQSFPPQTGNGKAVRRRVINVEKVSEISVQLENLRFWRRL